MSKTPTKPGIWWVVYDDANVKSLEIAHVWGNGQCHVKVRGLAVDSPSLEWIEEIPVPEKYRHLSITEQLKQEQKHGN